MSKPNESGIKITQADLERIIEDVGRSMAPSLAKHIGTILARLSRDLGDAATMAACVHPVPTEADRHFLNGFRAALRVVAMTGRSVSDKSRSEAV